MTKLPLKQMPPLPLSGFLYNSVDYIVSTLLQKNCYW
jgi:hypothetical protein